MTKKELVKIIQEAVKREVKKELKTIFINEGTLQSKSKKEIKFTNDKTLNKVLNETAGGIQTDGEEEYPTLGGGIFDSSRLTELMGYGKPEEVKRDMMAIDTLKKAGKSVNDVPEHITKALTRDYSDLMKAINIKKRV